MKKENQFLIDITFEYFNNIVRAYELGISFSGIDTFALETKLKDLNELLHKLGVRYGGKKK